MGRESVSLWMILFKVSTDQPSGAVNRQVYMYVWRSGEQCELVTQAY